MKRPAIFFDRDNTLIVSDGYLGDPAKVVLVEGAANAVAKARQYGFKVFIFSNQSGVARGMFTEVDVKAVNAKIDEMLKASSAGAIIEAHEYCPFLPDGTIEEYRKESDLRKPAPGMLLKLAGQHNIDLARSWVIGDAPRDIEAGKAAGCRTIFFTAPGLAASAAAEDKTGVKPDFVAATLKEAVEIAARNMVLPKAGEAPKTAAPPAPPIVIEDPEPVAQEARPVEKPAPRTRAEMLLEQIVLELKRKKEAPQDFSIIKMLAGVFQVASIAALFMAYSHRYDPSLPNLLLFSIALQGIVIAFLIMGKQNVS